MCVGAIIFALAARALVASFLLYLILFIATVSVGVMGVAFAIFGAKAFVLDVPFPGPFDGKSLSGKQAVLLLTFAGVVLAAAIAVRDLLR